jgi:hypothetical protein
MAFEEMRALLRELMPCEDPAVATLTAAPLQALAGALLQQHGLATAVTRLLPVMVPGNLVLHLDFDGYVPQVLRNERALLRVCQEAVSNVIRHTADGGEMRAWDPRPDVPLRLEVEDADPTQPILPSAFPDVGGRGLSIVEAVADDWGVDETKPGKTVWAVFDRNRRAGPD